MIMYIRYWTCSPPPNGNSGGPSRIAVNCLQQVTCTAYENAILAVLEHHVEEQTLPLGDSLLLLRDCWGYAPVYSLIRKSRNACESWLVYSFFFFLLFFSFLLFVSVFEDTTCMPLTCSCSLEFRCSRWFDWTDFTS